MHVLGLVVLAKHGHVRAVLVRDHLAAGEAPDGDDPATVRQHPHTRPQHAVRRSRRQLLQQQHAPRVAPSEVQRDNVQNTWPPQGYEAALRPPERHTTGHENTP